MKELDPDLRFIFEELTTNINFLNVNRKIINNKLYCHVNHKPTHSFSYLHLPHTKINIALSLAKRIVRIVIHNKNNRLPELKNNLLQRKPPEKIIDYSFIKLFQPRKQKSNEQTVITFTRACNSNHQFSFNKVKSSIKNTSNRKL